MIAEKPTTLFSPAFHTNPYPTYATLRQTTPIIRTHLTDGQPVWVTTRYADAVAILKDKRFSKVRPSGFDFPDQLPLPGVLRPVLQPMLLALINRTFGPLDRNMLDLDDPDHARLRRLVHKAFTPKMIEHLDSRIQIITDELVDAMLAKGEADLIEDLAFPLPITVIAEMLGIPVEDRDKFRRWSNAIVDLTAMSDALRSIPDVMALNGYLRRFINDKRANPGDDLVTGLIQAEEAGDKLTEDELLAMIMLLLIAGHETTVNLIGNGILALLQHSEQMTQLRANPELIHGAVEELLRYDSPVSLATERYAVEDVTMGAVTIPAGEMLLVGLGAANRDPAQFPDPDMLDLTRDPNKHLAFGQGIHYCLGAPLARMEGATAINTLLRRMPNVELAVAPEQLEWRKSMIMRGLVALPVRF